MKKSFLLMIIYFMAAIACRHERISPPGATPVADTPIIPAAYPHTDTFFGHYTSHHVSRILGMGNTGTWIYDTSFDASVIMNRYSKNEGSIQAGYSHLHPEAWIWFVAYQLDSPNIIINTNPFNPQSGVLRGDSLLKSYISYNGTSETDDHDTVTFAGRRLK